MNVHDARRRQEVTATATFAANRAQGEAIFDVRHDGRVTRRGRLHESGSLRVRFPSPEMPDELSAVFVNTAGGLAGGDAFAFDITAGEGSRLTLTTAAAEKVYRSPGPDTRISVSLRAQADATLAWLPQETILFDRARCERTFAIDLAESATLALCEMVVFGRTAMGERMSAGHFVDRWRVRRGGRLVFAETVRLDEDIGAVLSRPACANGGVAIGTALFAPGDEALVTRLRGEGEFRGEVGVSAWNGIAMARFCAQDATALRADMTAVLTRARAAPPPRLWL